MFLESAILILLAVLAYAWVGYPLLLRVCTSRRTVRYARDAVPAADECRSIAVLLSAHNEEKHIGARLRNLLDLDYPRERVAIQVGIDGSTDGTSRIAGEWAAGCPRIHVTDVAERGGKIAMLKRLAVGSGAEILVLTDANTVFERDALRKLMRHFDDPDTGGVCGRLAFDGGGGSAEGLYWDWETRMKERESALDSCLGANGAIYALRRELFWTRIPDNTVVDDFVLGMKVREQGFRVVYEPAARATEEIPDRHDEWRRRVRIGAGDFQALGLCRRCLMPRYGRFAWMFWSHKVLRWFTPHMCVAVALLSLGRLAFLPVARGGATVPVTVLGGAGVFLLCALAGRLSGSGRGLSRLLRGCDHFAAMQAALLAGFFRFCAGGLEGHWTRTPRGD